MAYVDNPKSRRRLKPEALQPGNAMECFLERALDHGNPQAGLFGIAYALTFLGKTMKDELVREALLERDRDASRD